jgi:hypothetical protein
MIRQVPGTFESAGDLFTQPVHPNSPPPGLDFRRWG